ncbi:hypothetical protein K502DRAFT_66879 [Neoconidiobolus thromboides FSU 785]|nr:hypothetical protein K502DRAFT_66879 [Neoconidiobolus thromboides FSU 785]
MSKKSVNLYPINHDIASPTFSINSKGELDLLEGHNETRSSEAKPDENNTLYNDSGLVHVSSLTLTDIGIKRAHPKKKIVQKHNHNDNDEGYLNEQDEVNDNVSKNSQKEKDNLKEVDNQEDIIHDELPKMPSKNMDFNRRLSAYSSLIDFDDHQGSNEKNIASTSYKSDDVSFGYGRRASWFDSKQNFPDSSYSSYKAKKFETNFGGNQNTKAGNINLNDSELKQACTGMTYTLDSITNIQSYSNIQAQYNSLNFNSGTPLNPGLYSHNINESYTSFPLAKDPHKTQNINILNSKTDLNINTQKAEKAFKRIDNSNLLSPERSHYFGIENGNLLSPERSNYFGMMPFENKLQMPIQHNLSSSLNKSPYNINRNETPNILFGKINNGGNPFIPNPHYSFEPDLLGPDSINKPIKNSLPPFSQAFGSIIDNNRQFVPKENKSIENHLIQPQSNVNANIPLTYCMDSINGNNPFPPTLGYQYQSPPNNLVKIGPNITQNNVSFSDKAFKQDPQNKTPFSDKAFNQEVFIDNLIENPNSYEDHKPNTYQSSIQNDPNNFIGPKNNIGVLQDAFSIPHKFQDDIQSTRGQFNDMYFSSNNRFGPNLDVSHIHNYDSSIMHQLDSTINPIDFQPQSFNPMRHNLNQPQPNLMRQNQIEINNYPDQYMMGKNEIISSGARSYIQNQSNEYIKRSNAPSFIPNLAHQKQFSNVLDRKNMKSFVDNNINGNIHLNDTDWNKPNKDSKRNGNSINSIDIFSQETLTPIKAIKELQNPAIFNASKLQDKNAYFNSRFNDPNEKPKAGSQIGLEKDITEINSEKEKINKLEVETKSETPLNKPKQTPIILKRPEGTLPRDKVVSESQNTAKVISILQNPSKAASAPQNTPKRITILQNINKATPTSQSTTKSGPEAYTENKNGVEVAKRKEDLIDTSAKGGGLHKVSLNKVDAKPLNKQESNFKKEGSNKTKTSIPENKSDVDNEPKIKAASKKVAEMPVFQESPYTIIKPKNSDKEKKKEKENIVENEVKPPKVDKEIEVSHIDLVLDDYPDLLF